MSSSFYNQFQVAYIKVLHPGATYLSNRFKAKEVASRNEFQQLPIGDS